jgi:hypothetical protein
MSNKSKRKKIGKERQKGQREKKVRERELRDTKR